MKLPGAADGVTFTRLVHKMSFTLDAVLNQAADGLSTTVALSATSVAVLLYATGFLDKRNLWLDTQNDPADVITDSDWDTIQDIVGILGREIMTPEVGAIFPYMTNDPPFNCLECNGASYLRVDFPLLYALLDSAFVIDADTFFVPDLRGRVPLGVGTGSGLSTYTVNEQGGEESHTLIEAELASHTHTDVGHTHTEGNALPNLTTIGAGAPQATAVPGISVTGIGNASLTNTGSDAPHENRQPFLALRFCVRCQ
jgi:microcystin-dependent protein